MIGEPTYVAAGAGIFSAERLPAAVGSDLSGAVAKKIASGALAKMGLKTLLKRSIPFVGPTLITGYAIDQEIQSGHPGQIPGTIVNGLVSMAMPGLAGIAYDYMVTTGDGDGNLRRQNALKDMLGKTSNEFQTLRNNLFGMDLSAAHSTERQLAANMDSLSDQILHRDISRPDEFERTINLMHTTAGQFADYLEASTSPRAAAAEVTRLQNYVTQNLGYQSIPDYVKHLRTIADQYSQGNIERQAHLQAGLSTPVEAFNTLRENGFGVGPAAPAAEQQLASSMASLNDQILHRNNANPNEYSSDIKLAHETIEGLANYFESSVGGPNAPRVQAYAAALGYENVADIVHDLRGLADQTRPTPNSTSAFKNAPLTPETPDEPSAADTLTPPIPRTTGSAGLNARHSGPLNRIKAIAATTAPQKTPMPITAGYAP